MRILRMMTMVAALALGGACGGDDDGGGSGADASAECTGADPLPFMCPCTVMDVDPCDPANAGQCFEFNDKGPHCTHECETDDDCEAPSTGCNGMGVCKAP